MHPITTLFAIAMLALPGLCRTPPGLALDSASGPAPKPVEHVIVPSLKGLVFLSKPEDVVQSGVSAAGVTTAAVPFLGADFQIQMSGCLNRPLTLDGLNNITHAVVAYYRAHNHPLVSAVAPTQNIDGGVVQVVVTEFRVGEIRPQGNKWFSDRVVTAPITLHHGDTIDSQLLVAQLDSANANPFRHVNLVYEPSSQPGYADLVLETQDRLPVSVFTGFDNSGLPVTGRNRWDVGVTWGNALWRDQQLSYQLSTSTDFFSGRSSQPGEPGGASFVGQSLTWVMPVRGSDSITVFGNYQRAVPNVGQDFGLIARSGEAGAHYNVALRRTASLVHTLALGYDFKATNNNLDFGGTNISRTNAEIDQFPLTYTATLLDGHGSTALATSLVFSPGHITPNNNSSAFQPAGEQSGRPFASARYVYWRSDLTRLTKLPAGMTWAARLAGQVSSANLLYTEQLAGGGLDILRGYDPNSVLGDEGVMLSNELRSPAIKKQTGETAWLGQLQPFIFWDWANMSSVHDVAGAVNHISAASIGAGAHYNLRSHIVATVEFGRQLQHLPFADSRDQLVSFSLLTAY